LDPCSFWVLIGDYGSYLTTLWIVLRPPIIGWYLVLNVGLHHGEGRVLYVRCAAHVAIHYNTELRYPVLALYLTVLIDIGRYGSSIRRNPP